MPPIISDYTIGELLSHENETIRRNAMSIVKCLMKTIKPRELEVKENEAIDGVYETPPQEWHN